MMHSNNGRIIFRLIWPPLYWKITLHVRVAVTVLVGCNRVSWVSTAWVLVRVETVSSQDLGIVLERQRPIKS